jgi:hypothetical protein
MFVASVIVEGKRLRKSSKYGFMNKLAVVEVVSGKPRAIGWFRVPEAAAATAEFYRGDSGVDVRVVPALVEEVAA